MIKLKTEFDKLKGFMGIKNRKVSFIDSNKIAIAGKGYARLINYRENDKINEILEQEGIFLEFSENRNNIYKYIKTEENDKFYLIARDEIDFGDKECHTIEIYSDGDTEVLIDTYGASRIWMSNQDKYFEKYKECKILLGVDFCDS